MAITKGILAGAGVTYLYDQATDNLISTGVTNISTNLNMAVTVEEGRGGAGNALVGQYFHTSTFTIDIVDQLFDMQYLQLNTGGLLTQGAEVMTDEQVTVATDGVLTISEFPQLFGTRLRRVAWYKLASEDNSAYRIAEFEEATLSAVVPDIKANDVVCVKYVKNVASALQFLVEAEYIPSTVHLIMKLGMYKTGLTQSELSSSSKLADFIVDVPNFQLNGTNDLALSSTSIAQSNLSGKALVTYGGTNTGCSDKGYYAKLILDVFGADEFSEVESLAIVGGKDIEMAVAETKKLSVKKIFSSSITPSLVDNEKLTFTSSDTAVATVDAKGVVTAVGVGEAQIEINVTSKPTAGGIAEIEVA